MNLENFFTLLRPLRTLLIAGLFTLFFRYALYPWALPVSIYPISHIIHPAIP